MASETAAEFAKRVLPCSNSCPGREHTLACSKNEARVYHLTRELEAREQAKDEKIRELEATVADATKDGYIRGMKRAAKIGDAFALGGKKLACRSDTIKVLDNDMIELGQGLAQCITDTLVSDLLSERWMVAAEKERSDE